MLNSKIFKRCQNFVLLQKNISMKIKFLKNLLQILSAYRGSSISAVSWGKEKSALIEIRTNRGIF